MCVRLWDFIPMCVVIGFVLPIVDSHKSEYCLLTYSAFLFYTLYLPVSLLGILILSLCKRPGLYEVP